MGRCNMTPASARQPAGYPPFVRVAVKLFAALREQAGARERALELADGATVDDVWPALGLGDEPPGLVYAVNRAYVERGDAARRRRRGGADPTRLRRRLPALRRAALARAGRRRGRVRRRGGDRDVRRHDAGSLARPGRGPARVRGVRGDGRGGDGAASPASCASGTTSSTSRSTTASGRSRSARRAS